MHQKHTDAQKAIGAGRILKEQQDMVARDMEMVDIDDDFLPIYRRSGRITSVTQSCCARSSDSLIGRGIRSVHQSASARCEASPREKAGSRGPHRCRCCDPALLSPAQAATPYTRRCCVIGSAAAKIAPPWRRSLTSSLRQDPLGLAGERPTRLSPTRSEHRTLPPRHRPSD